MHDAMELADQRASDVKKLLKQFLIASIQSKETGILEGEEVDSFFVDYVNSESEIEILNEKTQQPSSWAFHLKPNWWSTIKRINFDQTVAANGIKEYSVIICSRIVT